ncbi:hypothetical protein AVEN_108800-1 [Araneus ventricosus]|uniref:Secreted protein n=1 Tax=Araneus ventricosus TaxID=182803 RepID=A0A4Y2CFZ2_ARAVE|nr:hypothetical protein AVEN_108800-1 [Araneus ventricosus]
MQRVRESNFSSHCCHNRARRRLSLVLLIALAPPESNCFCECNEGKGSIRCFFHKKCFLSLCGLQAMVRFVPVRDSAEWMNTLLSVFMTSSAGYLLRLVEEDVPGHV